MNISTFVTILLIDLKLYLRNWAATFWTFLFPILLLVLLMTAFGGGTRLGDVTLEVRDRDGSQHSADYIRVLASALAQIDVIEFRITSTPAQPSDRLIVMTIPPGFGQEVSEHRTATVGLAASTAPAGIIQTAFTVLLSVNDRLNIISGRSPQLIQLKVDRQTGPRDEISYGQYLIAGIIGMVLFSTCLFGFTLPVVGYRQSGYLKILELLPVSKAWFFASFVTARLFIIVSYITLFLIFARIAYGIVIPHDAAALGRFIVLLAFGAGTFLSIGLVIAALAPSGGGALALCNLLYFCAVFASDLFIPTKNFPPLMTAITSSFPLQPLVSSFRATLFSGAALTQQRETLVVLCAWTLLCLGAVSAIRHSRMLWVSPRRLISERKS